MRKQKGFSLIELLIVVAIILIIAAIAIPNFLRAKMAANESSAVGSLRGITRAQVTYAYSYPTIGYADTLAKLGGAPAACAVPTANTACLMDDVVANAGNAASAKSGYFFTIAGLNAAPASVYNVTGLPSAYGLTGQKQFYADESGVVRYTSDGTVPTVASAPIQ